MQKLVFYLSLLLVWVCCDGFNISSVPWNPVYTNTNTTDSSASTPSTLSLFEATLFARATQPTTAVQSSTHASVSVSDTHVHGTSQSTESLPGTWTDHNEQPSPESVNTTDKGGRTESLPGTVNDTSSPASNDNEEPSHRSVNTTDKGGPTESLPGTMNDTSFPASNHNEEPSHGSVNTTDPKYITFAELPSAGENVASKHLTLFLLGASVIVLH